MAASGQACRAPRLRSTAARASGSRDRRRRAELCALAEASAAAACAPSWRRSTASSSRCARRRSRNEGVMLFLLDEEDGAAGSRALKRSRDAAGAKAAEGRAATRSLAFRGGRDAGARRRDRWRRSASTTPNLGAAEKTFVEARAHKGELRGDRRDDDARRRRQPAGAPRRHPRRPAGRRRQAREGFVPSGTRRRPTPSGEGEAFLARQSKEVDKGKQVRGAMPELKSAAAQGALKSARAHAVRVAGGAAARAHRSCGQLKEDGRRCAARRRAQGRGGPLRREAAQTTRCTG